MGFNNLYPSPFAYCGVKGEMTQHNAVMKSNGEDPAKPPPFSQDHSETILEALTCVSEMNIPQYNTQKLEIHPDC